MIAVTTMVIQDIAVFDIGATRTRVGYRYDAVNKYQTMTWPTPKIYTALLKKMEEELVKIKSKVVICGVAAVIDRVTNSIITAPNLPDYSQHNLQQDLARHGFDVRIYNDLELTVLGESIIGKGKNYKDVAYLSIGTGAGAALASVKKLVQLGRYNFEVGFHLISLDGPKIPGKTVGSFESFVSGSAAAITTKMDPRLLPDTYWESLIDRLAQTIVNIAVFWNPEIVVLGGSVAMRFKPWISVLKKNVKQKLSIMPPPEISFSTLGDRAALSGGFALAISEQRKENMQSNR